MNGDGMCFRGSNHELQQMQSLFTDKQAVNGTEVATISSFLPVPNQIGDNGLTNPLRASAGECMRTMGLC